MKHLDLNSTIGEWISEKPQTCHMFASLCLDDDEGRGKSLQQACWERLRSPLDVLAQLRGDAEHDQQNSAAACDLSIGLMEPVSGS